MELRPIRRPTQIPDTTSLGLPGRTAEKRPGLVDLGAMYVNIWHTWSVWGLYKAVDSAHVPLAGGPVRVTTLPRTNMEVENRLFARKVVFPKAMFHFHGFPFSSEGNTDGFSLVMTTVF